MNHDTQNQPAQGKLLPEGTFVIQLRSDSDLPQGQLRGRVEHVMSGESEPFSSLESLVAFMVRYASTGQASE